MLRGKTLGWGEGRRSGALLRLLRLRWRRRRGLRLLLRLLLQLLPPRRLGVARRGVNVDRHGVAVARRRSGLGNDLHYRLHHVDLRRHRSGCGSLRLSV